MNRFYLSSDTIQGDNVNFPADRSHQIARVLRLQIGEKVVVFDHLGNEYLIELIFIDSKQTRGKIISIRKPLLEPKTEIKLLVALTQREKFEFILQKCTEIGVHSFTPVITERSLVQFNKDWDKKSDRWQKIVVEAAEQSHRTSVPLIHPVTTFQQCMKMSTELKLIAHEAEQQNSIKKFLSGSNFKHVALLIGPEGGYTEYEVDLASKSAWNTVTLGPRILRMETAAIVACALILEYAGDQGGF